MTSWTRLSSMPRSLTFKVAFLFENVETFVISLIDNDAGRSVWRQMQLQRQFFIQVIGKFYGFIV